MTEPTRWANDDSGLSEDERRVFAAGLRPDEIPREMAQVVWGGITAKLPLGAASATVGASATKAVTALSLVKLGLTGVLVGSVATVAWVGGERLLSPASHGGPMPSAGVQATAAVRAAPRATSVVPAPALDPIPDLPARPSVNHERPSASREPPAEGPTVSQPPTAQPERSVASFPVPAPAAPSSAGSAIVESRRVAEARARLRAGDARGALSTLESVRRDFPGGVLSQERDALTIEALLALGARKQAKELAIQFLARYPESPHRATVESALR